MKRKVTYPPWIGIGLKWGLGLLFFAYVFYTLQNAPQGFENSIHLQNPLYFWLALALMPINLGLEALKWQLLLAKAAQISLFQAFRAVLSGLTLGIFTPNRLGEFAGRLYYILPRYRLNGAVATLAGSLVQTAIYYLVAAFILATHLHILPIAPHWHILLAVFLGLAGFVLLLLYFRVDGLVFWLQKIRFEFPFKRWLRLGIGFRSKRQAWVLLIAALRYAVVIVQLYALMRFWGFTADWQLAWKTIPLLFMGQVLIPSFVLTDLGIRGGLAVFFLEDWAGSPWLAILPSYLLWLINVLLPAGLGLLSLLFWRSRKSNKALFLAAPPWKKTTKS